jgi:hypothetical protein
MQKQPIKRSHSEMLFFELALVAVVMLPYALLRVDGLLLAISGLLITGAAMQRPSFRVLSSRPAGKIAAMIAFSVLTFWLIWLPVTHRDSVIALQSYTAGSLVGGPVTPGEGIRRVMGSPELATKAVNEFWIRRMLPPTTAPACYTGDPMICTAVDEFTNQSYQNKWDWITYTLALISCLIPAIGSAAVVGYFTRSQPETTLQNPDLATDPISVS